MFAVNFRITLSWCSSFHLQHDSSNAKGHGFFLVFISGSGCYSIVLSSEIDACEMLMKYDADPKNAFQKSNFK